MKQFKYVRLASDGAYLWVKSSNGNGVPVIANTGVCIKAVTAAKIVEAAIYRIAANPIA